MRIELDAFDLKTCPAIAYPTCDGDPHRPDPDLARWRSNDRDGRELRCRQGHRTIAMETSAEDLDINKLAHAEVSRAHQAISDFRAKLLALLPLASGAGIFLLLDNADSKVSSRHLAAIGLFGFTVTVGLFIYEPRGIQQCHNLRLQAALLENILRFPEGTAPFRDRTDSRLAGVVGAEGAGWIVYTAVMAS